MAGKRNIYRTGINVAIFILLEVAALGLLRRSSTGQEFFISKLSHGFIGTVWGWSQSVGDYFALRKINENLSGENFALQTALARAGAAADSLRSAGAGAVTAGRFRYTKAEVVKSSRNKHHNYLIVDKGSKDGVTSHTGIISANGIIGIIDSVGTNYSYAISFLNSNFNLSARIGREGAVGPMAWNGSGLSNATLREISLQHKFEKGDTVFTSGHSSIFPPDIPLGLIEDSRIINGSTYDINVHLFQDYSAIRYVTLVSNLDRKEIAELENKEDGK